MKKTLEALCPGCDTNIGSLEAGHIEAGLIEVGILTKTASNDDFITTAYCYECSVKIKRLDLDSVSDSLDLLIRDRIGNPISISEQLVREISKNLGATQKVEEALIEHIFGAKWSGPPPKDSSLVMNSYKNRDRLVAFVAMKLQNLWTLESQ